MTQTPRLTGPSPFASYDPHPLPAAPDVEIVVPVKNEERDLPLAIARLSAFLASSFPFSARVTIADNGSTDGTWAIAQHLADHGSGVRAVRLKQSGRGRALRATWTASDATVVAYMDVDLSTDLAGLLPLVAPLLSGHSDVAIGSRLARSARVVRGPRREIISRSYNLILRTVLGAGFSDAQCGFKAVRADLARRLLPAVQDESWFFDTELLVLAEASGLRIHEVPVDWIDDPDSRVDIARTAKDDLKGVARMARGLAGGTLPPPDLRPSGPNAVRYAGRGVLAGQFVRFLGIGVASTLAYLLLFLLLRAGIGAQPANALALAITAVGNTAANRRVTFRVSGGGVVRQQLRGFAAFLAGLVLTSGALAALHAGTPRPSRVSEVAVLVAANLVATVLRFALYRLWVFRDGEPAPAATVVPTQAPTGADRAAGAPSVPGLRLEGDPSRSTS